MKRISLLLFLIGAFLLPVQYLSAQIIEPVHWSISEKQINDKTLQVTSTATIDEGWHIYDQDLPEDGPVSTKIVIEECQNAMAQNNPKSNVKATEKFEELFQMKLRWFEKKVTFTQTFLLNDAGNYSIKGYVEYMACNDNTCLPPSKVPFSFKGKNPSATSSTSQKNVDTAATPSDTSTNLTAFSFNELTPNGKDTTGKAQEILETQETWQPVITELKAYGESQTDHSNLLWSIFCIGLLGGLLAIATPCVWPIIPMTVSFFLHKKDGSGKRSALLYGLSIIVIYVALGFLLTLLFGSNALNTLSTNAVFNLFLFVLLVFFAISFFGGFDLTLPASWSTKTESKADNTTGLLSILLMAFTLVIVSFSCTGPIIGTLLVHISTEGEILAPIAGMLGFAIALACPFTLFALFPSIMKKLPKSGGWLNIVKVLLGFFELAFSLKFLSVADLSYGWHILDREVFLVLWIVISAMAGLYLIGKIKFAHDDTLEYVSVPRLFGGILSFAFALYLVPGLWGAPLKSISAFAPPMNTQDFNLYNETEAVFNDYDDAIEYAKKHNKPILVDFSGYGCVNCRKMEAVVWDAEEVQKLINEDFVLVSLFTDDRTRLETPMEIEENGTKKILETQGEKWSYLQRSKFGANAQPFYVIIDSKGKPLNHSYAYSENINAFVTYLKTGLKNYAK